MDNRELQLFHFNATTMATTALDGAAIFQGQIFGASEVSGRSPMGPEADEECEDDDFSWMDDMEAAGAAPV